MMKLTISLLGGLYLEPSMKAHDPKNVNMVGSFIHQAREMGYEPDSDIISVLLRMDAKAITEAYVEFTDAVSELKGANVDHKILFPSFPDGIPTHYSYALTETYGTGHGIGIGFDANTGQFLFVSDQGSDARTNLRFDEPVDLTPLKLLTLDMLIQSVNNKLNTMTSLSKAETDLIVRVLRTFGGGDIKGKIFKEKLPVLAGLIQDQDIKVQVDMLKPQLSGATDVLRIATYLSNPEADLSLTENTKFKLNSKQRRLVFELLSWLVKPEEDMLRHRNRWIRLGEVIHPGKQRHKTKYPDVFTAFDTIRNSPEKVWSFQRELHPMIAGKAPFNSKLAESRPGIFARNLDALIRNGSDPVSVMESFNRISPSVPFRTLLQLYLHFNNRNDGKKRHFMPKGTKNRLAFAEDYRKPISQAICNDMSASIWKSIVARYTANGEPQKFYVDENLYGRVLPFNKRGDSATAAPMEKGSQVPFDHKGIVRFFVHWSKARDVDLSMIAFDEDWNQKVQVSFTALRGEFEAVHSGDITSGYNGATEYIDFNVQKFLDGGVRYVCPVINSYSGELFSNMNCFGGFMKRSGIKSGELFEPATVEVKFDIDQPSRNVMPFIFDLEQEKVISLDITGGANGRVVENQVETLKNYAEVFLGMASTKPTVGMIIDAVAEGTGAVMVDDPLAADVVFDFGLDVDAFMVEYVDAA